jgi:preprotein translocase SecF subunit
VLFFNFNLGLDFTGGTIVKVNDIAGLTNSNDVFDDCTDKVTDLLTSDPYNIDKGKITFQAPQSQGVYTLSITYNSNGLTQEEISEISTRIAELTGGTINSGDTQSISATASSEKLRSAFIAVSVALMAILIYIAIRFKFTSGVAGIIGLLHDVLVMASLVAIFRIQINFVFIAVLITIVGYSINNTLVLFDRIRDYEKHKDKRRTTEQIVDASIKETFGRTLNTTITTFVPVFILAIIGVPQIREFAIPIVFGLVAGMYSSVFLTTALYVRFERARQIKLHNKKQLVK